MTHSRTSPRAKAKDAAVRDGAPKAADATDRGEAARERAAERKAKERTEMSRQSRMWRANWEIRRRIITLEMPPGAPFTEAELASQLKLSKTPVREALLVLNHDGLVYSRPGTGYRVAPVTVRGTRHLCQLRALLEGEAAFLAASNSDVESTEMLYLQDLAILSQEPYDPDDADNCYSTNATFHAILAGLSQNRALASDLNRVQSALERVHRLARRLDPTAFPTVTDDHEQLAAAISRRDPAAARGIAVDHVATSERRLVEILLDSAVVQAVDVGGVLLEEDHG